jgi:hypothetical protein
VTEEMALVHTMYAWNQDHWVNWQVARVLQPEPHYWKRRVLEALWIQCRDSTSNLHVDCGPSMDTIVGPSEAQYVTIPFVFTFFFTSHYLHPISVFTCI